MSVKQPKLLIAASGTGGHLFPALATAQQLADFQIEWLGVPNRLETTLVPESYLLHTIDIEGFQTSLSLKTFLVVGKILRAIGKTRQIIIEREIDIIFTTGGYISAPAIIAAKLAKIPVILHESNSIPGKVTKLFARWCDFVGIGFESTANYLPQANTKWVSTPVREQFLTPQPLDLAIPDHQPLIVVIGGSQGAVALNKLVRQSAPHWLEKGMYIVHLTGDRDDEIGTFTHPHYLEMPFYDNMAGLLQRADLAISRSGAGTLTELAVTQTPSILIPYPFAAEDHQYYNGQVFVEAGGAKLFRQDELNSQGLTEIVIDLLNNREQLQKMSKNTGNLALPNSAEMLAKMIRNHL